ncbi:MAG: transcriptional repressor [Phycisphaerales bacterium]|nr:transcriptional repressor [Phycisphaerales bacterium]
MPARAHPPEPERLEIIEPLCAVFRRMLKGEGLKYTPERAQLLDTIVSIDGLFDADKVMAEVKRGGRRVSKATVYRTLKLLAQAGIVHRVMMDEDQAFYEVAYGERCRATVVRLDTHQSIPVDVPELRAIADRACAALGLRARGCRLQIIASDAPGARPGVQG